MSHVTHMYTASCYVWHGHVTWLISYVWHDSLAMTCVTWLISYVYVISSHTHVWVMSYIHQTYIYTHAEWVTSPIWMTHVTHVYVSCHTYVYESCHTCMSHVTHMNEHHSCWHNEWFMSHTCMSHVIHIWVMPYNTKGMCVNVWTYIDIWGGYGQ